MTKKRDEPVILIVTRREGNLLSGLMQKMAGMSDHSADRNLARKLIRQVEAAEWAFKWGRQ